MTSVPHTLFISIRGSGVSSLVSFVDDDEDRINAFYGKFHEVLITRHNSVEYNTAHHAYRRHNLEYRILFVVYLTADNISKLSRMSGQKRDNVTGGWRNLHNKELDDLYSTNKINSVV
jgi:hypothetical protein